MADVEVLRTQMEALETAVFTGSPPFMDVPDEFRLKVEEQVKRAERLFWLRVTGLDDTAPMRLMLRRAVYAEQRCWEMENMLAEMALIARGAGDTIKDLASGIDPDVGGFEKGSDEG